MCVFVCVCLCGKSPNILANGKMSEKVRRTERREEKKGEGVIHEVYTQPHRQSVVTPKGMET